MNFKEPIAGPSATASPVLDLLATSLQGAADLLGQITAPCCIASVELLTRVASAARDRNRAAFVAVRPEFEAWMTSDFSGLIQEIEQHPDGSVRARCRLVLEGIRIGAQETGSGSAADGLLTGLANGAISPQELPRLAARHVLRDHAEQINPLLSDSVFARVPPNAIAALIQEADDGVVLLSSFGGTACPGLVKLLAQLRDALRARDAIAVYQCNEGLLAWKQNHFDKAEEEIAAGSADLRDKALCYLCHARCLPRPPIPETAPACSWAQRLSR